MKKFIKIPIILLLIILVTLTCIFYKNIRIKRYTKENNSFDLIDVNNYDVFLSGETHTLEKSRKFEQDIFTYLNKKAGVNNIIEETGFCSALLLNEYIETGNKTYLRIYMDQLKGTMAYTRGTYEFYKWLYKYNLELDKNSKIKIYGMDIEQDSLTAIKGIKTLIDKNKSVPKSLEKAMDLIEEDNIKAIKYLKLAYDEYKEECKEYFGDEFIYFENGIKNLYPDESGSDMRDKIMMNNFKFVYSLNKGEKFFGQFGSEHIYQNHMNSDFVSEEEVRFGTLINSNTSPVKNKVYSLLCVYENKEGNSPSSNSFDYSLIKNIKVDTFIELTQENSPFYDKEYLFKGSKENTVTCDYIQGLMILKDSKQTQPYYEDN